MQVEARTSLTLKKGWYISLPLCVLNSITRAKQKQPKSKRDFAECWNMYI